MCFYNDDCGDWSADVHEETFKRSDAPAHCHECSRDITVGEWARFINQQEHEMCQICEDEWGDGCEFISTDRDEYEDDEEYAAAIKELAEHEHDYGELWKCTICRECCLVLEAIYDLERIEGCPEYARQPSYGELDEALHYDDGAKYAEHAVKLFPELAVNGLVAKYRRTGSVA